MNKNGAEQHVMTGTGIEQRRRETGKEERKYEWNEEEEEEEEEEGAEPAS